MKETKYSVIHLYNIKNLKLQLYIHNSKISLCKNAFMIFEVITIQ